MTEAAVLKHIAKLPHARATFKQLVKELGVKGDLRHALDSVLDRLTDKGELIEIRNGIFVVTRASREYILGRVVAHRDGYGFVIPDPPVEWLRGDLFLPPGETDKAMHGDRVLARVTRHDQMGRAEGEILKIVKRAHQDVVGEFKVKRKGNFVVPHDDRIRQWILIPEGMETPPAGAASVDRVGGKAITISSPEDLDGMIVNVQILEHPEGDEWGVGRVIEILGHPDDFGVDVEVMIRKHHIPHRFPEEVLAQARRTPNTISEAELLGRRDFRGMDVVTIDGETARDFDDAVWVERLGSGNFALHVHIADVSHYVRPGSAIDQEAALRGTSVYFPDRAVPMLPVELSTDICSLRPGVDRLVLSALLEIDSKGDIVGQVLTRGVIRSVERMTYTAVHQLLDGDPLQRERYAPLVPRFELMRELALILNRKRQKRGSIDFDLPEPLIEFNEFGEMEGVARAPRNIAHRIIEEFMLSANEAVAAHVDTLAWPFIYRIHEPPDLKRVADFEQIAAHFGYSLGVAAIPMRQFPMTTRHRDGRKSRHDVEMVDEGKLQVNSKMYQKLVAKIEGKPEERILSYLMLRSLRQARYSEKNTGHFALAAPTYTHFTSPIRRYPDLMVHRVLGAWLDEQPAPYSTEALHTIADDSSFTERRAAEAERELVEWKKLKFMADRVGEDFEALIIQTAKYGFFVELEELFIEGLVPVDSLPGDRFSYSDNTRKIVGQKSKREFSIGDKVTVVLDRVDAVEKKLQFSVYEPAPRKKKRK